MKIDIEERIREIWGEQGSQAPPICAAANLFQQWADRLCADVVQIAQRSNDDGVVAVNQAYIRLVTRYFDMRNALPRVHRNHIGENGPICIFHIFERCYQQLHVIELSLRPPLLFLPPPPPVRPPRTLSIADVVSLGALSETTDW